ncbi:MAG: TRAP transporter substrate-binding protein [Peptococcaceae bacterium]|nr:TRAP transporter substrate-binding protein [Peptococcaceae bacterium]
MKRRSWIALLGVLLIGIFAFTIVGCGGGGESTEGGSEQPEKLVMKFSHVVAEKTPKGQAALKFAKLVAEKSGGTMEVQVYPSSSLYTDHEELEALISNNCQFIAPSVTKLVKLNPSFQIVDMPFLFKDSQQAYNFFDSEEGQALLHSLEDKGILGLAWWPNGTKNFTNSVRPLKRPEDFKNLKFRTQSGALLTAQFEALDAGAQPMAFSEVYQALQNGTVDGQENTFNNIWTQKYPEVQKYMTVSHHGRLDYAVLTNTTFWNSLTDEQKQIITEAMEEATAYARELADKLNQDAFEKIKESGKLEIYTLTDEDRQAFIEAMQPVYDEFGPKIGEDLIEAARNS